MNELKIAYINIQQIKEYENNPRYNDDAVEPVMKSIQEYGFKVPIIIDKNNVIVAGHTRVKAAKRLGLEMIPCVIASDLTDEQIRAFRIADNKTSDFSIWDNKKLMEELEALSTEDLFTGFDIGEDDFLKMEATNSEDEEKPITIDDVERNIFQVTFTSESEEKINRIKEIWDEIQDEDNEHNEEDIGL